MRYTSDVARFLGPEIFSRQVIYSWVFCLVPIFERVGAGHVERVSGKFIIECIRFRAFIACFASVLQGLVIAVSASFY